MAAFFLTQLPQAYAIGFLALPFCFFGIRQRAYFVCFPSFVVSRLSAAVPCSFLLFYAAFHKQLFLNFDIGSFFGSLVHIPLCSAVTHGALQQMANWLFAHGTRSFPSQLTGFPAPVPFFLRPGFFSSFLGRTRPPELFVCCLPCFCLYYSGLFASCQ